MRRLPVSSTIRGASSQDLLPLHGLSVCEHVGDVRQHRTSGRARRADGGDLLINAHSGTVLRHNAWYFFTGRNAGLIPYFFPGVLALVLFYCPGPNRSGSGLRWRPLRRIVMHGSVAVYVEWGRRSGRSATFSRFYALFLVLIPSARSSAAWRRLSEERFHGADLLNPFSASLKPGDSQDRSLRMLRPS